jgi:hypothetical protein
MRHGVEKEIFLYEGVSFTSYNKSITYHNLDISHFSTHFGINVFLHVRRPRSTTIAEDNHPIIRDPSSSTSFFNVTFIYLFFQMRTIYIEKGGNY